MKDTEATTSHSPDAESSKSGDATGASRASDEPGKATPAAPPAGSTKAKRRVAEKNEPESGAVSSPDAAPVTTSLRAIIAQSAPMAIGRSLTEVKLSADPARVLLFSDKVEGASLHYEPDEAVRTYFHCPGTLCPYCRLGKKLERFHLAAVFAIATREVSVLRISVHEGPNRLLSLLRPHLADPEIDSKVLAVSRIGFRYIVDAFPIRPGVDVGTNAISQFLEAYARGQVKLASTFPSFTIDELKDVAAIKNELEVLDGPGDEPGSGPGGALSKGAKTGGKAGSRK